MDIDKFVGLTFAAIFAYLIIKNAGEFNTALGGFGNVYSGMVSTLQGR